MQILHTIDQYTKLTNYFFFQACGYPLLSIQERLHWAYRKPCGKSFAVDLIREYSVCVVQLKGSVQCSSRFNAEECSII